MELTPQEYERHCAYLLQKAGWRASTTVATGDQGADVLAQYADINAVLQCKMYSQPVGNAAVQQVIAARVFYDCNLAAVITNAGFTKAAEALAKKAFVVLLHHDDLEGWARQQLSPCRDLIIRLRENGFAVKQTSKSSYAIDTPSGTRFVNGDSALEQVAKILLRD